MIPFVIVLALGSEKKGWRLRSVWNDIAGWVALDRPKLATQYESLAEAEAHLDTIKLGLGEQLIPMPHSELV